MEPISVFPRSLRAWAKTLQAIRATPVLLKILQSRCVPLDRSNDEERWSTPKKDRCFTDEEIKTSFENARANPIASISCSLPCVRGPIKQAKHQVAGLRTFPDRPEKLHRLRKRPTFIVQPCLASRACFLRAGWKIMRRALDLAIQISRK